MTQGGPRPGAYILPLDLDLLERAPGYELIADRIDRAAALARALAASPAWRSIPDAVIVARTEPPERLVALGRFTVEDARRLESLAGLLPDALRRLKYVSYADAERIVGDLADRLVERVGRVWLDDACFVAQPRGGLIVLGMLAYELGLRRDQVGVCDQSERRGQDGPIVLVDDCSLSGLRFREFLARHPSNDVVFAHLYSHPDLRQAIEEVESRVRACVASRDLVDHAPGLHGTRYEDWLRRWRERSDPGVYWIGLPDHVGFSWSEPDITTWNDLTSSEEAAWRLLPPELCLRNRAHPVEQERWQVQPESSGRYRPSPDTVYATRAASTIVANCVSGQAYELEGISADLWSALVMGEDPEQIVDRLASEYGIASDALAADMEAFTATARERGLLVVDDGA